MSSYCSELSQNPHITKVTGVQFCVMSPNEILQRSVVEITKAETWENNNPVPNGLFDARMGVIDNGKVCPTDLLDNRFCPGYFGHIKLEMPVYYYHFMPYIQQILNFICYRCSNLLITEEDREKLLKKKGMKRYKEMQECIKRIKQKAGIHCNRCNAVQPSKYERTEVTDIKAQFSSSSKDSSSKDTPQQQQSKVLVLPTQYVLHLFRRITDEDVELMGFHRLYCRPDWMICSYLPVCPPAVRPSVKQDNSQRMEDDLTHKYIDILKTNATIKNKIANKQSYEDDLKTLQYHVASLMDNEIPNFAPSTQRSGRNLKGIKQRITGKEGRVRGNLMGKRVNFSARTVITPDPTLEIDEIGVPYEICKELTFPERVTVFNIQQLRAMIMLLEDETNPQFPIVNGYPGAKKIKKKLGNKFISLKHFDAMHRNKMAEELEYGDIVERHLLEGDIVLFNRQPSLHKMSMMAHRVKPMNYKTFRLNPNVVTPYNADFDGDEMNLHVPQSIETANEIRCIAEVEKQEISPAKNRPIIGPNQDTLVGSYLLTGDDHAFNNREMMNAMMKNRHVSMESFAERFNQPHDSPNNFIWKGNDCVSMILPDININLKNVCIQHGKVQPGKTPQECQFDKETFMKASQGILHVAFNDCGSFETKLLLDNVCSLVSQYLLHKGFSVGIGDLMIDESIYGTIHKIMERKKEEVTKRIQEVHLNLFENLTSKPNQEAFEDNIRVILQEIINECGKQVSANLDQKNRLTKMVTSGSKGSQLNISQMIACLGQQAIDGRRVAYGFNDRTLPHFHRFDDNAEARGFVENSFIRGLTPQEMFFHAMGGREGLIDTAVKTSDTGYIQRKLIKALEDARVHYDRTVRDANGHIIQFIYGEDGMDACSIENQILLFPFGSKNLPANAPKETNPLPQETCPPIQISTMMQLMNMYRFEKETRWELFMTQTAIDALYQHPDHATILETHYHELETIYKDYIIEKCKYSPRTVVKYPVCFERLIRNAVNLFNIDPHQLTDLDPVYVIEKMNQLIQETTINQFVGGTFIFKLLCYNYLSPKQLLIKHRISKEGFDHLLQNIHIAFQKSFVQAGEMVGTIAAQSIGEPATQMTLNTFHFAGVGEKSNVTRGVPRVRELLNISKNLKNPSLTIYANNATDTEHVVKLMNKLELTTLRNITTNTSIYFTGTEHHQHSQIADPLMEIFKEFQNSTSSQSQLPSQPQPSSNTQNDKMRWVLRIDLNKKIMLDKHLKMEDIYIEIMKTYANDIQCLYADDNADVLMMNIEILSQEESNNTKQCNDYYDDYCVLKILEQQLLDKITLCGITGLNKVVIRPNQDIGQFDAYGNFTYPKQWVLDTDGTALLEALIDPEVDAEKTISNDINEIYDVLGIEAARNGLVKEIANVLKSEGLEGYDIRHINLLAEAMTCRGSLMSIDRHGINRGEIGPLAKISFEETEKQLYQASVFGEIDYVSGVSSNIMLGQVAPCGSGIVNILFDECEFASYFADKNYPFFEKWIEQYKTWQKQATHHANELNKEMDRLEMELEEELTTDNYCSTDKFKFAMEDELDKIFKE